MQRSKYSTGGVRKAPSGVGEGDVRDVNLAENAPFQKMPSNKNDQMGSHNSFNGSPDSTKKGGAG